MSSSKIEAPKLLLIDDSIIDLKVLLDMLHDRAFNLHIAFDGRDGIEKAELLLPDLILLDVTLPQLDGFAGCRLLKSSARTRRIPVIFLTASTDINHRIEGFTAGAVDYITKPFHPEEVIARVQVHLELSRTMRALEPDSIKTSSKMQSPTISRTVRLTNAAIKILRANLRNPGSTEELARQVGTNERALLSAFHQEFSLSVSDWIREERLHMARYLLTTTDTSIQSISQHLGYSNQANFAKSFRQRFGFTPSDARNEASRIDRAQKDEL